MFEIEAHPYFQNQCRKEPQVESQHSVVVEKTDPFEKNLVQLEFPIGRGEN